VIDELKKKFTKLQAARFVEAPDEEIQGLNPEAFELRKDYGPDDDAATVAEKMVRDLFYHEPKSKVYNVKVSPSTAALLEGKIAGTIVVTGVFK
jgi:hypothetical protein